MKLNLRRAAWGLVFSMAILATPAQVFAYQSQEGMAHGTENGRGRDKDTRDGSDNDNKRSNANNRFYNLGLNQGQYDREHNRGRKYRLNPSDATDRQAYQAGYAQGYTSYNAQNDPYPQSGHYGQNRDGQYNNGNNPGFRAGSQYGAADGRNDRAAGRPRKYGSAYAHSDRGYKNGYGDKNAYREQYQLGYQEGYQQAYGTPYLSSEELIESNRSTNQEKSNLCPMRSKS